MADSHTYTDEYRRECADLVIASGRPATQMADEIGVNRKTLQHWVQRRKMELEGAMPTTDPELKAAQKRIRELEMENAFLKKSGLLRQRPGVRARYRLMEAEKTSFPVKTMARLLGVSRSGFYEWLRLSEPEDPWLQARADVEREWAESDRRFGARLVRSRLPHLTLYRVRKIMRGLGIRGVTPDARKRTTIPDAGALERPDLLKRDFTSPVPTYKLVGDITYLKTGQGWLLLSTVIDLNTRMVVGWSLSGRMTADIVVGSLEMACRRGYVAENAIFHSDRGAQYTLRLVGAWAADHQVRLSVGRTGSCHDNAVAESFFATLENEMCHLRKWPTRDEARHAVVEFIESYYNRRRPHSTIGCRIPAEAMDGFFERTEPILETAHEQAAGKLSKAA